MRRVRMKVRVPNWQEADEVMSGMQLILTKDLVLFSLIYPEFNWPLQ